MITNRLYPLILAEFNAGSLTNAYQLINGVGFSKPCNLIHFINNSDVSIMISYDGSHDHDVIRKDSDYILNAQLNYLHYRENVKFSKGTQIYVKYILGAGKRGSIRVVGYYQ